MTSHEEAERPIDSFVPIFAPGAQIEVWPVWRERCRRAAVAGGFVVVEQVAGDCVPRHDDPGIQWLIGQRPDRGVKLEDVVSDANDEESAFCCRAFALLARADFGNGDAILALKQVCEHDSDSCSYHDLQRLFAMLAHERPEVLVTMFPHVVAPEVLALCGQQGLDVALHELKSRDAMRREQAAQAIEQCVLGGLDVPRDDLLNFLLNESDEDRRAYVERAVELLNGRGDNAEATKARRARGQSAGGAS